MKPKNFPARKLQRQIEAKMRDEGRHQYTDDELKSLDAARGIRTKKNRGSS